MPFACACSWRTSTSRELPHLLDGVPPALARFRRADYLGDPAAPLDVAVRDLVQARLGARPAGPVRMLAHLRSLGHCFNPVAFYFCFAPDGRRVDAVVAEVTSTPWGERHAYVAAGAGNPDVVLESRHAKEMHVSPFMPMEMTYRWRVATPGERLVVRIESLDADGRPVFDAHLALRRRAFSRAALLRATARHPGMTLRVLGGIYGQALRLRLKGARWHAKPEAALSVRERAARRAVHALLQRARGGTIELVEGRGARTFGTPAGDPPLHARVAVHDPAFHVALLSGGAGAGRAYVDGLWDCEDLVGLVRIAARAMPALDRWRERLLPLTAPWQRTAWRLRANTRARARERIAAHYDLGNTLFSRFLDESMTYSCAIFERPQATLHEAQLAKLDRICRRLDLRPGERLLEIGSGWGGLALHAAGRYGAHVTTTTISREQHAHATAAVRAAGLEERVTVLLRDYRDLRGRYDKLVSVEMIEAVGWERLDAYFAACSELLEPHGAMLLQAIVHPHRVFRVEKASTGFINAFVFPGGTLPSMLAIERSLARRTDLRAVALDDITPHYARTLACWRERFHAAWPELRTLGYDERFRRLWDLYLAYCEAGFRERRVADVQLLLAKPGWRGEAVAPPARLRPPRPEQVARVVPQPASPGRRARCRRSRGSRGRARGGARGRGRA